MRRILPLAALLAISFTASAWLFRPEERRAPEPESPSCGEESACSTAPVEETTPETSTHEPPMASRQQNAPAPQIGSEVVDLRVEADRLIAEGRVLEGVNMMRKATEADPSARNHGDFGHLLQRLTAFDEALVHLRRAAELDPGNADRWIALANAYYRAVNPGEAWKAEKRAKEAEPGLELGRAANGMRVRKGDSEPRIP
jgi:hypothetical protein